MQVRFQLQHHLSIPLPDVMPYLTDLSKFGTLHPLMEKVDALGSSQFCVHEFKPLPFGMKLRFKYNATVHVDSAKDTVVYQAKPQGISISICFKLKRSSDPRHTVVIEDVTLNGFPPFPRILESILKKSHIEAFFQLESKLVPHG